MAFPVLTLLNGMRVHCDGLPTISPCVAPGYACWVSPSNCWGGIVNITNGRAGILPGNFCNTTLCPLGTYGQAHFNYIPSLVGNSFFSGIFGILLVVQIFLAFRHKTWSFLVGMFGGMVLEVIGYVGRVLIHNSPFAKNPFLLYLICVTIGPAFLCASIYLCLGRLIIVYSESLSRVKPRTCTIIFVCCDIISLVLQAVGGALASTANTNKQLNTGTHIMVAGLSFQVLSLLLFICLAGEFALRVLSSKLHFNPTYTELRQNASFKMFLYALPFATLCIFVRCCFRVGELSEGFGGPVFRGGQVTFMVLEGTMIGAAVLALTIAHPGPAFGGIWGNASKDTRREAESGESVEAGEVNMDGKR